MFEVLPVARRRPKETERHNSSSKRVVLDAEIMNLDDMAFHLLGLSSLSVIGSREGVARCQVIDRIQWIWKGVGITAYFEGSWPQIPSNLVRQDG
ncbi:hypothetical protein BDN72DRAFT_842115 [Pluteus cervinus]|uniref:Uncharacterized protein n=1 Tax=Pluteus cervinus TaxID=181527 RepID=A0ACD3AQH0_9AGAR|nr:hypothetical protein BDN72DRAFT_842115 [Pluteus cervinus]